MQFGDSNTQKRIPKHKDQSSKFFCGACGRTRTYEVVRRLISKEGAFAAQPHMRDRFEISDLTVEISDSRSLRAKK